MRCLLAGLMVCLSTRCLQAQQQALCEQFNTLNTQIRDGQIALVKAKPEVLRLLAAIRRQTDTTTSRTWIFPLSGYGLTAVGGKNGSGYVPQGYRFFDGNRHGGHPAHDIFIRDANQDCIDDRTGHKVPVLAIAAGIIVAVQKTWKLGSPLRGGKYILIYHPATNRLSYYAHLDSVRVDLGEIVEAGSPLGLLGRTGLNAYKKRSPTHLHVMVLRVDPTQGLLPVNPYGWWARP